LGFTQVLRFYIFSWDCVYFKILNKATFLKQSIQKNCFLRQFAVSKRMQHSRAPGPLPDRQTSVICSAPLVGTICEHGSKQGVDCLWNVMAHAQKPDFVFRRNGRVHLNRRGRQFSRLLAAEVCASAVVMLDTPCSEVVWSVLAAHSIRQFPLHFLPLALPCAITFQLDSTTQRWLPTPFASFPFTSPPVRHRVPSHFSWTLLMRLYPLKQSICRLQIHELSCDKLCPVRPCVSAEESDTYVTDFRVMLFWIFAKTVTRYSRPKLRHPCCRPRYFDNISLIIWSLCLIHALFCLENELKPKKAWTILT
jgi:hypothetical protein